jgi:PA14 domain
MNNPLDPTLRELKDCGCCAGTTAETPVAIENRPGLEAIDFRAGKHPQFKATMLAALTTADNPALRKLKTRDNDDFTIALLDGWATVADVLSFYSERIANESFLRTATERLSVLELARSIGYELNPGVAASTWLAFTVEEAEGAPGYANIDKGTKMQSIPGPGETPQVFETIGPLFARKEWNELHPRHTYLPAPRLGQTTLRLQGTTTNLRPGDALLVLGDKPAGTTPNAHWDFRRVKSLATFPNAETPFTLVTLDRGLENAPAIQPANAKVYALRQRINLFGYNAPDPRTPPFTVAGLLGEYFEEVNFARRVFTRVDAKVDFNWTNLSPGTGLGTSNYSVRWTGVVKTGAAGNYVFSTSSDDGVRLWVNGQLLIDKWVNQGITTLTGDILLEAGKFYDLRLEYFQGGGAAEVHLSWKEPNLALQIIPADRLFRTDWPGLTLADISGIAPSAPIATLQLEGTHPEVVPGSWLVVFTPEDQELCGIKSVAEDSRSSFTLNTKTTRVGVDGEDLRPKFNDRVRAITVFAQSEELPWAPEPVYDALFGEEITLDQTVPELPAGRDLLVGGMSARVRVTGEGGSLALTLTNGGTRPLHRDDLLSLIGPPVAQIDTPAVSRWDLRMADGTEGFLFASAEQLEFVAAVGNGALLLETVSLKRTERASDGSPRLVLAAALKYAYDPTTAVIHGNAAFATNGETTREVLGSGDANQPHQRFVLKETPLTYIPAANASGGESTLEIWINDVRWREVPTLFGAGSRDRVYIVRLADDGKVTVLFGDGKSGARLPTGNENVGAVYRKGIGLGGLLKANQLTLLMTQPLGVKSVTNLEATAGAVDPQVFADARQNAPTTVLTLDRVVSLKDYEDFARNFSGVAKALATWTWNVNSRGVFLTVAGLAGASIAPDSTLRSDLLKALRDLGNPLVPAEVKTCKPVKFGLAGTVFVDSDRVPEKVESAVKDALKAAFSFDARSFGQPVALSEVEAVIQNVPGVAFVDLDALYLGTASGLQHYLPARKPDDGAAVGTVSPAELLTLDEASLSALKVQTI